MIWKDGVCCLAFLLFSILYTYDDLTTNLGFMLALMSRDTLAFESLRNKHQDLILSHYGLNHFESRTKDHILSHWTGGRSSRQWLLSWQQRHTNSCIKYGCSCSVYLEEKTLLIINHTWAFFSPREVAPQRGKCPANELVKVRKYRTNRIGTWGKFWRGDYLFTVCSLCVGRRFVSRVFLPLFELILAQTYKLHSLLRMIFRYALAVG